jgi:hypothetical protein
MSHESEAMKELHAIREENYEKTKKMTKDELFDYYKQKASKTEQRLEEMRKVKH